MNLDNTSTLKTNFITGARKIGPKNHYLISTGLGSLDAILDEVINFMKIYVAIGGGVTAGSILLIEEDEFGTFSKVVMKHFLSEGVVCHHDLLIASQSLDTKTLVSELPAPFQNRPVEDEPADNEQLNIAWRYRDMPKFNSSPSNVAPFVNIYNMTKNIGRNQIENVKIHHYNSENDNYTDLLKYIYGILPNDEERVKIKGTGNILRIVLHSIGTVLWEGDLLQFLFKLRALTRITYASCLITVPTHLFENVEIIENCEHLCDAVLKLESLSNKGNPAYSDYHGLLYLRKLPSVNNWSFHVPETQNWAFKLKHKQFLIEKLHISPDLAENVSREEEDVSNEYLPECIQ